MRADHSYQSIPSSAVEDQEEGAKQLGPSVYRALPMVLALIVISVSMFTVITYTTGVTPSAEPVFQAETVNSTCTMPPYSSTTLKLAHEEAFVALFRDAKDQYKFEASDVVMVGDDFYAVCDSSSSISRIGINMTPYSSRNLQIGAPDRHTIDSEYEALAYDNKRGIFYVVRESIEMEDLDNKADYHALIEELRIHEDGSDYTVEQTCITEFKFEGTSKGFEGVVALRDAEGEVYLLALCEGNHCKQDKDSLGFGKLIMMRKVIDKSHRTYPDHSCYWKTTRVLAIPKQAAFADYSAIAVSPSGRVAITSQEESQVWLGWLSHWTTDKDGGHFHPQKSELCAEKDDSVEAEEMADDSRQATRRAHAYGVFDFPRDNDCNVVYCNIEGVHWLTDDLLVTVSDKAKKDKQDFRCVAKDQSIHVFAIPR